MGPAPHERNGVKFLSALLALCSLFLTMATLAAQEAAPAKQVAGGATNEDKTTIIVMIGAPGEDEFGKNFEKWGGLWAEAAQKGGANHIVIGLDPTNETSDLDRLNQALSAQLKESPNELWVVLLGHGTFDGREAKFNLRGPDLTATNLASMLRPFHRPLAVINCASASAPFINALSAPGRVIITATRSGSEQNYARFGRYFSEAIANPEADLDKDGQTSLLEAFLMASRQVTEFYKTEGRLATEHPLLDDNGDGFGTPADWFHGIRAVKRARDGAALDGLRANQFCLVRSDEERKLPAAIRARRYEIELEVSKLRDEKGKLKEDDYYHRLEVLLLELAKLTETNSNP